MNPIEVYFDTNAITYFFRWQGFSSEELNTSRVSLGRAVRDGRIRVLGSQYLLEELARVTYTEPDFYRELHEFFWNVVGPFVLLPSQEAVIAEARLGRPLDANERFDLWTAIQQVKRVTRDIQFAKTLGDVVYKKVKQSKLDSEARRQQIVTKLTAQFKNQSVAEATRTWWDIAEAQIQNWVADYLRNSREFLGLPDDSAAWPSERDLRTAWQMHAFMMARIVLTVGLRRRIAEGDDYDAHHFASACYGQLLVTDDGAFRETCDLVPNRVLTLERFDEFVKNRLST